METNNSFDHFAFNKCRLHFFSLESEKKFTDHMFDSKSVVEKLCFLPSTKSRFFIPLNCLLAMSFHSTHFEIRCLEIETRFCYWCRLKSVIFYISLSNNHMETQDVNFKFVNS